MDAFRWTVILGGVTLLAGVIATLLLLLVGLFTPALQQYLPVAFGLSIVALVMLLLILVAGYASVMAPAGSRFRRRPMPICRQCSSRCI